MDSTEDAFRRMQRLELESEALDKRYEVFYGAQDDHGLDEAALLPALHRLADRAGRRRTSPSSSRPAASASTSRGTATTPARLDRLCDAAGDGRRATRRESRRVGGETRPLRTSAGPTRSWRRSRPRRSAGPTGRGAGRRELHLRSRARRPLGDLTPLIGPQRARLLVQRPRERRAVPASALERGGEPGERRASGALAERPQRLRSRATALDRRDRPRPAPRAGARSCCASPRPAGRPDPAPARRARRHQVEGVGKRRGAAAPAAIGPPLDEQVRGQEGRRRALRRRRAPRTGPGPPARRQRERDREHTAEPAFAAKTRPPRAPASPASRRRSAPLPASRIETGGPRGRPPAAGSGTQVDGAGPSRPRPGPWRRRARAQRRRREHAARTIEQAQRRTSPSLRIARKPAT